MDKLVFYRAEARPVLWKDQQVDIQLHKYYVKYETPQMYFLYREGDNPETASLHRMMKNAKRPWARTTPGGALNSLLRRKEAYLDILDYRRSMAQQAIKLTAAMLGNMGWKGPQDKDFIR